MCPSTLEIGAGRRSSAPLQKSRFETDAWGNSEMANLIEMKLIMPGILALG